MSQKLYSSNHLVKLILLLVLFVSPLDVFGASASLQYFSPSTTVSVGGEAFFRVTGVDFSSTISYAVSDSFSGTSVSSSKIDSAGNFIWRPLTQDIGTHSITVTLTDTFGNAASVVQQIIVPVVPKVVVQNLNPSSTVNSGQTVFFNAFATGFTNPVYVSQ